MREVEKEREGHREKRRKRTFRAWILGAEQRDKNGEREGEDRK